MDWSTVSLEPLEGGFSGETFVAHTVDGDVVVRTYARDPERVRRRRVLAAARPRSAPGPGRSRGSAPRRAVEPGVLVTRAAGGRAARPAGRRPRRRSRLGRARYRARASARTLAGIPFLHSGVFAGPDLAAVSGSLPDDLTDWARTARATGRLSIWSDADWCGTRRPRRSGRATAIAAGPARAVLVHSDFNLKNLLVDPISWQLTAVVDWEFAHAGSPDADLGNLTRFERDPAFVSALVEAFDDARARSGRRPPPARPRRRSLGPDRARGSAARRNTVSTLAERLLLAQARERDLNAWPFDGDARLRPRRSARPRARPTVALALSAENPYPERCAVGLHALIRSRRVLVTLSIHVTETSDWPARIRIFSRGTRWGTAIQGSSARPHDICTYTIHPTEFHPL